MNEADPRVIRTRKMLQEAFASLLSEKSFQAISVQEIAERATLNRATFYAHFEDKYALMDRMIRDLFLEILQRRVTTTMPFTVDNLRLLMVAVFEFISHCHGHCAPPDQGNGHMPEAKAQEELSAFLLRWLEQLPPSEPASDGAREIVAMVMSWAIFGAGIEWARGEHALSSDEWARKVLPAIISGVPWVLKLPERADYEKRPESFQDNGFRSSRANAAHATPLAATRGW